MAYSSNPKWPILSGTGIILTYIIVQLNQPLISNFKIAEGNFIKYSLVENESNSPHKMIKIWISNTKEPFINEYPGSYNSVIDNLDYIKNQKVTIWYSNNQEIRQLKCSNHFLIKYNWFNPWLLLILALGISFVWGSYIEMKEKCSNISTIWDMFDYVFGGRELIMKYNNKPYNI